MAKKKMTIEDLEAAKKAATEKVNKAKEEQNRIASELNNRKNAERTSRLCRRAGYLETKLIEPEIMTDQDVYDLIDYLFTSPRVTAMVQDIVAIRRGDRPGSIEDVFRQANAQMSRAIGRIGATNEEA